MTSSIITLIARCWLLLCSSDCLERKEYRPLQVLHVTQSSTMTSHTADDSDDVIVLDSSDSRHHAHGRKSHGNCDVSGLLCGYFFLSTYERTYALIVYLLVLSHYLYLSQQSLLAIFIHSHCMYSVAYCSCHCDSVTMTIVVMNDRRSVC